MHLQLLLRYRFLKSHLSAGLHYGWLPLKNTNQVHVNSAEVLNHPAIRPI